MKRPKIGKNIEKNCKTNPSLAQIPIINPRYIRGSGVLNTPLDWDIRKNKQDVALKLQSLLQFYSGKIILFSGYDYFTFE